MTAPPRDIVIVGGGATGVELAAQLHEVTAQLAAFGLDQFDPQHDMRITVIEGADRVLPALPPRRIAFSPAAALIVVFSVPIFRQKKAQDSSVPRRYREKPLNGLF